MKKFLLVIFIGMVLAINLYGIVNKFMIDEVEEIDHTKETTMTVYVEQLMLFLLFLLAKLALYLMKGDDIYEQETKNSSENRRRLCSM